MTKSKTQAPFGMWASPIDGAMVAGKTRRFGQVLSADGWVWWSEARPYEDGRSALMRMRPGSDDGPVDMLAAPWSASSRVNEYGGGEFCVSGNDVFFVNAEDQDIHRLADGSVSRITDAPDMRFADIQHDAAEGRLLCVGERQVEGLDQPDNLIVAVSLDDGGVTDVVTGHDFFGQLRLSDDGKQLAWIAWDLPDMPWDQAALFAGDIAADGVVNVRHVAGGSGVAIFQPEWDGEGRLCFISDESGIGVLQRLDGEVVQSIDTGGGELSRPLWLFGMRSHGSANDGTIGAASFVEGVSVFTRSGKPVETGLAQFDDPVGVGGGFAGHGSFHDAPPAVVHLSDGGEVDVLRCSADIDLDPANVSHGEVVRYRGSDGDDVVAVFYPPRNVNFEGPAGTLPPAIVTAHGGSRTETQNPVLDQPRFCGSRCRLLRELRLRAGVPGTP